MFRRDFFRYYEHEVFPATLAQSMAAHAQRGHADLIELGYGITMNLTADFAGVDRPRGDADETSRLRSLTGTFSEGATLVHSSAAAAKNNIAPNNYYFKAWQGGVAGTLWPGSGIGPTYDERIGVDLSAPGEGTIVALAADSHFSTATGSIVSGNGNGKYIFFGAVSGAAPIVTGVVALMLEKNPQLDAAQVKSFLQQSAHSDANTGSTPNPSWGYGKLDALAALDKVAAAASAVPVTVVEFYNQSLDHYFITWAADEIVKLDTGVFKGWARTGQSFLAYVDAQSGTAGVCRIYIPPGKGDGHFFGRDKNECDGTMVKNPTFNLESAAFFYLFPPTLGNCAAGQVPVYRVYSNRVDANHRYTTDRATRDLMVGRNWVAEGDGADIVVMCAPT